MKKRIISFILVLVMFFGLLPTFTFAANVTEFAGGSGIEGDPYLVETKYHLNNVRNYLDAHFKMIADIEFTDADFAEGGDFYNDGQGFEPIGSSSSSAFKGNFDGDGHIIKNLCINISLNSVIYASLFGYNEGTIENLGLVDGNVFATSPFSTSYAYAYAGGIVGINAGGTIENCYNTGSVSALAKYYSYAGGITGKNYGTIINCYNTGDVSSISSYSGYSYGSSAQAGGIVGENSYGTHSYGTMENCYNTGTVSASASSSSFSSASAGGIVGINAGGSIKNCYYLDNISKGVAYGTDTTTKCTAEQLKLQSTFVGFDFENIWTFLEGNAHPYPTLNDNEYFLIDDTLEFNSGNGTEESPYCIASKKQLNNVRDYLDAHFKLVRDIEFTDADFESGGTFYNNSQGWLPIGTTSDSEFIGTFDGNGYSIKNLYINRTATENDSYFCVGLFGHIDGIVKNLGMIDSFITATSSFSDAYAGGIVGSGGTIEKCYNTGTVRAFGKNYSYTGGIVAISGIVSNCYNIGYIESYGDGINVSGGITGVCGIISNCYNAGKIVGTNKTGGIVGENYGTKPIQDCYYLDINKKGSGSGNDTSTKCTAEEMVLEVTYYGFDFENVWTMAGNECYPYPELKNVKFTTDHMYDNACDTTCNCGYVREATTHNYQLAFDGNNHFDKCTVCNDVINTEDHEFENACDTTCDCGYEREVTHDYKDTYNAAGHFEECTICGSIGEGEPHEFDNACDRDCNCGYTRITSHKYDNACDKNCNICGATRTVSGHVYDNSCDTTCNICGATRAISHKYDNSCDSSCNVCGATRTTSHKYGEYTYNYDATSEKDGTKTRICSVCKKEETVTAKGTKLINSSKTFKDVPANAWYKKFVDFAVTNGIFKGTSDKTFSPEQNMTRAQFVMVFANLSGIDTSNNNVKSGFKDVPKGKWYTAAVTWAAKNNIVSGVGDGKFDPEAKVTREQMCVMLVNYIEKYQKKELKVTTNAPKFADDKNISSWAKTAVYKCAKAGLVNGVGNNKFDPSASATRAQGATIFTSFYKSYLG